MAWPVAEVFSLSLSPLFFIPGVSLVGGRRGRRGSGRQDAGASSLLHLFPIPSHPWGGECLLAHFPPLPFCLPVPPFFLRQGRPRLHPGAQAAPPGARRVLPPPSRVPPNRGGEEQVGGRGESNLARAPVGRGRGPRRALWFPRSQRWGGPCTGSSFAPRPPGRRVTLVLTPRVRFGLSALPTLSAPAVRLSSLLARPLFFAAAGGCRGGARAAGPDADDLLGPAPGDAKPLWSERGRETERRGWERGEGKAPGLWTRLSGRLFSGRSLPFRSAMRWCEEASLGG